MAFTLAACLMMSSMTVLAATTVNYDKEKSEYTGMGTAGQNNFSGSAEPTKENCKDYTFAAGDTWTNGTVVKEWKDGAWAEKKESGSDEGDNNGGDGNEGGSSNTVSIPSGGSVSASTSAPVLALEPEVAAPQTLSRQTIMDIVIHAETVALQATAHDEGFADMVDLQNAAAKNMSAGEYYNNAVVKTPGIEEATPVAQGGGIIINGVATNVMATISKVDVAFVDSVRASVEGTVLNVVDVRFPAVEATINFYMPGVAADANIVAVQYVDGAWVNVEVAEVRADHVVLNLKQNGKVAFLAK